MKKVYLTLTALLFFLNTNSVSAAAPSRSAVAETEFPPINQVADILIAQKEKSEGEDVCWMNTKETHRKFFAQIEKSLREGQSLTKYQVAGNVGYEMSLRNIKNFIQKKFKEMREEKKLLTKQEFEERDPDKWFWKGSDLTRIWGAEYLAEEFELADDKIHKVPEYIIVVENLNNIEVKIHLAPCFPIIAEIVNGSIYASKIEGKPIANAPLHKQFGYTDTSAPGNVIRTAGGLEYYVDTEYKSFYDGIPQRSIYKRKKYLNEKCEFLQRRFKYLNDIGGLNQTVTVSVED